jgi:hypothetical protein
VLTELFKIEIWSEGEDVSKHKQEGKAIIRVKPFKLDVKVRRDGFVLEFRGLGNQGEMIELHLEFPMFWLDHMSAKLLVPMLQHRAKTHARK